AIWGGGLSALHPVPWQDGDANVNDIEVTKYLNVNSSGYVETRAQTTDDYYTFGIEGLLLRGMKCPNGTLTGSSGFFSGEITLKLEIRNAASATVCSDEIRLRVAPWLGISHAEASQEIWAIDWPTFNQRFLNEPLNNGYAGLSYSGQQLRVEPYGTGTTTSGSQWFQDHVEIGYSQRPGGPKMHVVFRVPYDPYQTQPLWPKTRLLSKNVGIFQIGLIKQIRGTLGGDYGGNYGGNLEFLPPSQVHPHGVMLMGDLVEAEVKTFLMAQEFQYIDQKSFSPPSKWLKVGHVDEYSSFLSGSRVVFADSRMGIEKLEDTAIIPAADRGKKVFFATSGVTQAGTVVSGTPFVDSALTPYIDESRRIYLGTANAQADMDKFNYIRFYQGPAQGWVAKIKTGTVTGNNYADVVLEKGNSNNTIVPCIWFTGKSMAGNSAIGDKGYMFYMDPGGYPPPNGANVPNAPSAPSLWPNMPAPNAGNKYVLVEGTKGGYPHSEYSPIPAFITVHEILMDAEFVDFNKNYSYKSLLDSENAIRAAAGAESLNFTFVPALFFGTKDSNTLSAAPRLSVAFNPGPANLQPLTVPTVGNALFVPRQFGPVNNAGVDIYESAIRAAVSSESVYFVDDWELYHVSGGEVHCGSIVKRALPATDWWTKIKP
ncbi:MAG: hypothetical protein EOO09_21725, partial [Chitinophagaceae bacterium]